MLSIGCTGYCAGEIDSRRLPQPKNVKLLDHQAKLGWTKVA
jgi:hypothetical protein